MLAGMTPTIVALMGCSAAVLNQALVLPSQIAHVTVCWQRRSLPKNGSIYGMSHVARVSETIAAASSRRIRPADGPQTQVLIGLERRSNSLTARDMETVLFADYDRQRGRHPAEECLPRQRTLQTINTH